MRIVLAEDNTLRKGLTRLLSEDGHQVVAAVGDGEGLVAACDEHRPEVVIADVRMPPTFTSEGLRAALTVRRRHPGIGVLVLSQYVDTRYAAQLIDGGVRGAGYLLKDRVVEVGDFLEALRRVAGGGTAFDPEVVRRLLNRARDTVSLARLSVREHEVLALMTQGHTNESIAARLHVSRSAVEKHANAIFDKLGCEGLSCCLTSGRPSSPRSALPQQPGSWSPPPASALSCDSSVASRLQHRCIHRRTPLRPGREHRDWRRGFTTSGAVSQATACETAAIAQRVLGFLLFIGRCKGKTRETSPSATTPTSCRGTAMTAAGTTPPPDLLVADIRGLFAAFRRRT